ncbi:hypothetical protein NDU88_001592 [Pleurodeles waltl]|uniref:Uncharacterized protein n=1 Tax=Pleurodeles waltl TaxID=8319 RepID=A0AAV7NB80_PLEWA|nr:hypothetical protein NDU88_001592 [Pleurodeles waltl]
MIQAGGRVIQGYPTEARRIRWGKVLHHLQRVYASQRSGHQLKHRWADLITREQDLLDHLGIMIGGTVGGPAPYTVGEVATFEDPDHYTANMTPDQVCEFQRRAMRYQHILLVESGFRRMARRYRHERASRAWRAFPQGGPTVPTTANTETTTNESPWPHPQLPLLHLHLLDFLAPALPPVQDSPHRPPPPVPRLPLLQLLTLPPSID